MAQDRHTSVRASQLRNSDVSFDDLAPEVKTSTIGVVFTNEPNPITAGAQIDIEIPYNAVITGVTMLADTTGTLIADIYKDTYTNFAPSTSITGASKPTITSDIKSKDSVLSGWTTTISAGEILRINIDSNDNITRCLINLIITRT